MFIGPREQTVAEPILASRAAPAQRHLAFIDCARGYAVLMVIACHLTKDFPGLPWPVRRLMMSGCAGVQLFFLASCVTLMMSWHADRDRRGRADLGAFFIRRFFRIAPAYYLAGALYLIIDPPALIDPAQALWSAIFINAWQPAWISVVGGWIPVPGGWSISVEFTFYALFPLFVAFVSSWRRAALVCAACVLAGAVANRLMLPELAALTPQQRSNFLFFWFPNQACIFPAGGMLYFLLRDLGAWRSTVQRHATSIAGASVLAFCALSTLKLPHFIGEGAGVPGFIAEAAILAVFIVGLAGGGAFTNAVAACLGRLSFSAYLLHFAWLPVIAAMPRLMHTQSTGYAAIAACFVALVFLVACTIASAWLSWRFIEQPMVAVGRKLIQRSRSLARVRIEPAIC